MSEHDVDLYNNVYADFQSRAEANVRRQAFGEDIGQSSWLTAADWLRFADLAGVGPDSHVLEVGSGSGGPAVFLAAARNCRVTGIDVNEHGVRNARRLAADQRLADRVTFQVVDASRPLPFPPSAFDAVLSNDAMCHISNREAVLADWRRVLSREPRRATLLSELTEQRDDAAPAGTTSAIRRGLREEVAEAPAGRARGSGPVRRRRARRTPSARPGARRVVPAS